LPTEAAELIEVMRSYLGWRLLSPRIIAFDGDLDFPEVFDEAFVKLPA